MILGYRFHVGGAACPLFKGSSAFHKAEFSHLPSAKAGYEAGLRITYRPTPLSGLPIITYPLLTEDPYPLPAQAIELHEEKSEELQLPGWPDARIDHVTLWLASGGSMTCYVQETPEGWNRLVFNFTEEGRNQVAIMEVHVNFLPECWHLAFVRSGDTISFARATSYGCINLSDLDHKSPLLTIMENLADLFREDIGSQFEPTTEGLTVVTSDGKVVWRFNVIIENTGVCYCCGSEGNPDHQYLDAVLINFANGHQVTGVQTVEVSKDVYAPLRDEEHRAFYQRRSDQAEDLRWSPMRRAFIGTLARLQASLPA
jgi:hypothetical protein